MNYCTVCKSFYQVAGTCNCFISYQTTPAIPTTVPAYPTRIICNGVGAGELLHTVIHAFRNTAAAQPGIIPKVFNI